MTKKQRIKEYLISGFGVPEGIRIPDYKPSIAERLMFKIIKGRELKESDYKLNK